MIGIHDSSTPDLAELWARTLVVAEQDSGLRGAQLLRKLVVQYRATVSRQRGAGWIARVEAAYYKPKRKPSATTAPPPAPDSFID